MTEIKICGITNLEDAKIAALAGADALGFIFHPGSPRHVTPERAKGITSLLPVSICKVGVFVDCDAGEVKKILRFCRLDLVQLHGHESPDYCRRFSPSVLLKAVVLRSEEDLAVLNEYPVKAVVVDTYDPEFPGGTGRTCDWNLAKRAGEKCTLILAGGLNSGNIHAAIERVRPRAVDIASGVEARPGKKDPEKIREFIAAVKGFGPAGTPAPAGRIFQRL
ncbi:MAG: phosphoribosylanthranilate isomerase [Deltaproteobacteria bacterium]|nr:phosphoribosylanthranilate isomerase [Deltaproteobacteria bacterium]